MLNRPAGPRAPSTLLVAALAVLAVGCSPGPSAPVDDLDCGQATARPLCEKVAAVAVARMNLVATGPIHRVALGRVDCVVWGRANFRSADVAGAADCWIVEVTGERSHGGGPVVLRVDGRIEALGW